MTTPAKVLEEDAYAYTRPGSTGELVMSFTEDGDVKLRHEDPPDRPNTFKDARRIMKLDDDAITVVPRRNSKIVDYRILDVTVSHPHGKKNLSLCHFHQVNQCCHVRRVDRYRREREA